MALIAVDKNIHKSGNTTNIRNGRPVTKVSWRLIVSKYSVKDLWTPAEI